MATHRLCLKCRQWHRVDDKACPECGEPKSAYNPHMREVYLDRHLEMSKAGVPYSGPIV
jgi:predicted amidophosphoribosyltransferase